MELADRWDMNRNGSGESGLCSRGMVGNTPLSTKPVKYGMSSFLPSSLPSRELDTGHVSSIMTRPTGVNPTPKRVLFPFAREVASAIVWD